MEPTEKGRHALHHVPPFSAERAGSAVFFAQPDGSLAQAVPPGYVEPSPPSTPIEVMELPTHRELQAAARLLRTALRTRGALVALLVVGLVAELLAARCHVRSAARQRAVLQRLHPHGLGFLHQSDPKFVSALLLVHSAYSAVYYVLGTLAALRGDARLYRQFSRVALLGAVVQPTFAAVAGTLSFVTMFHRLAACAHADTGAADIASVASLRRHRLDSGALEGMGAYRSGRFWERLCPPRRRRRQTRAFWGA
mmetsp:Transcript_34491/g.94960  ORF Transcript_34491/g.94960 Transcript_34491/m.94960 type:complete len:253 (-) Transcript_34491:108-866(-)